jgi:hypothetical protein
MSISNKEWRWVAIWTIMIMLITSLPYIYGLFLSTPQLQFSGFFLGVEDANSYLAKMRQGADGSWLFHLSFTPEPHEGAFLFTFHFFLGKLASIFGWSPTWVYHLARVIFGMGLLFTVYYFISYFVQDISARRFAFLLVALGSGLGWLLILLQLTPSLGLPIDLYVPEAFIFLVLFHLPHLALAESLLFWSILFTLQSWESNTWRPVIWAGCALLLMSLIAAFYLGVFVAVLGLTWLVLSLSEKSIQRTWKFLVKIIIATAIALPVLIYDLYVFTTNPIFKIWNQQNLILSPELWHYLLAYGLLMIPAVYGGKLLMIHINNKKAGQDTSLRVPENYKNLLLIIWCLVFPILVYLPFNLQRRLVIGVQLPLVILATYAIFQLTPKYIRPHRQQLARGGIILFSSLTNIFLLIGGIVSISPRQAPIFHPVTQVEAMQWLDYEANGEVVLAVYETGNVLPAYANVRVFAGHGPETINSDEKRALAKAFFSDAVDDTWRLALLKKFNVRYIYYGPNEKAAGGFAPSRAPYLREIYKHEDVQIFEIN